MKKVIKESDKRKYQVPCPHCNKFQVLKWSNVQWEKDKVDDKDNNKIDKPETAVYICDYCSSKWTDSQRHRAVLKGKWIPEKPFNGIAGFWLNELYSPWVKLSDMVNSFLIAKNNPETLKTFINTSLGETWEETEELEGIDENELINRTENYNSTDKLNNKILVITAGVDVQNDRLECEIVGWASNEESWSLEYIVKSNNTCNI